MPKLAAAALCLLALTGCQASISTSNTVSQAELEKQVAAIITPDDPSASVEPSCAGELAGKVDATQDCHLDIGDQKADVHVTVTSVDGGDVAFDVTPFLPADTLADAVLNSLTDAGYAIDSVDCDGELLGVVDETATCTAQPEQTGGDVVVTATSVDGLLVKFDVKGAS